MPETHINFKHFRRRKCSNLPRFSSSTTFKDRRKLSCWLLILQFFVVESVFNKKYDSHIEEDLLGDFGDLPTMSHRGYQASTGQKKPKT